MSKPSRKELGDFAVASNTLFEAVKDGTLPSGPVIAALLQLADGQFPQDPRFDRYNHLLLSLDAQKVKLLRYDRRYWDGRLRGQILALDTMSDHIQRVDDLEFFHVQFDSREETVEMWWRVYVGEQPKHWRWNELKLDPEHLRFLGPALYANVRQYWPGIYRSRINLVAHWEPEDGRTLEEVREGAEGTSELLAQLEVLSAWGLHSELFREQDGKNLPYSDMAGTDVSVPGRSEECALSVGWGPFVIEARLDGTWIGGRENEFAAPVLVK